MPNIYFDRIRTKTFTPCTRLKDKLRRPASIFKLHIVYYRSHIQIIFRSDKNIWNFCYITRIELVFVLCLIHRSLYLFTGTRNELIIFISDNSHTDYLVNSHKIIRISTKETVCLFPTSQNSWNRPKLRWNSMEDLETRKPWKVVKLHTTGVKKSYHVGGTSIHSACKLGSKWHLANGISGNDFPHEPIQTRICEVQYEKRRKGKQNRDEYVQSQYRCTCWYSI